MANYTRHAPQVKAPKHSKTSKNQPSNRVREGGGCTGVSIQRPLAIMQAAVDRQVGRQIDGESEYVYGPPPSGRGGGSVPQFDPYQDEWGNQLEED